MIHLLAGDIGGTKTLLELCQYQDGKYTIIKAHSYASSAYANFELVVEDFLEELDLPIDSACFGVAGPVNKDREGRITASVTNLPWKLDSGAISDQLNTKNINIINDFQSVGYGLTALGSEDLFELQAGQPQAEGNLLVIGAGTGLGVAQLLCLDGQYQVMATEGGHAGFSPASELETELCKYLINQFGYSSLELVLSGPGLVNIYRFLAQYRSAESGDEYMEIMKANDKAAAISSIADIDAQSLAGQAMAIFVHIYGSHVGDFCLTTLPRGGAYIAGGIAPKILDHIRQGSFMEAFGNKGKMAGIMGSFPLNVVTNPKVGLIGSREYARLMLNRASG